MVKMGCSRMGDGDNHILWGFVNIIRRQRPAKPFCNGIGVIVRNNWHSLILKILRNMANHFFMSKMLLRMTSYFLPRINAWLGHKSL